MFEVNGANGQRTRISGITFRDTVVFGNIGIYLDNTKDFRVDHCSFDGLGSCGVATYNSMSTAMSCGVVDHCSFSNMWEAAVENAGSGFGYGVGVGLAATPYSRTAFLVCLVCSCKQSGRGGKTSQRNLA